MAKDKKKDINQEEVNETTAPSEEVKEDTGKVKKRRRLFGRKKDDEQLEEVIQERRTEAKAVAKMVRITPRKAKLVIDLVRGLDVSEALALLANVNKSATPIVVKTINSAVANAVNNFGLDEESLYISEIYASEGTRLKRYRPRARGSASGVTKRTSHITVVVKERA